MAQSLVDKINNSCIIQKYIDEVSHNIENILSIFAMDYAASMENEILYPLIYNNFFVFLMGKKGKRNLDFIHTDDIVNENLYILKRGNVRERCALFCNILKAGKNFTFINWLCTAHPSAIPDYMNRISIKRIEYKGNKVKFSRPDLIVVTHDGKKTLLDNDDANKKIIRLLRPNSRIVTKYVRSLRPLEERETFKLKLSNIVPVLSEYERKKINVDPLNPIFLEYFTGLQKWSMNENSLFTRTARKNKQNLIAGPSGHTDSLFFFFRLFNCYNIEMTTLLCILWLVPCQHHSIYEILYTAKRYGLRYNIANDALTFAEEMFEKYNPNSSPPSNQ